MRERNHGRTPFTLALVLLLALAGGVLADIDPVGGCCFEDCPEDDDGGATHFLCLGACCQLRNEETCEADGGKWAGPFSDCTDCLQVVPVSLQSFTIAWEKIMAEAEVGANGLARDDTVVLEHRDRLGDGVVDAP